MTADEAIQIVKSKASGRTRWEGQPPFLDEVLVAEVERLREALHEIAYHGIDMPSNREFSETDWWHRIAFSCMGIAKEALEPQ